MAETIQGVYPALLTESFADSFNQPFWDAAREGRLSAPRCDGCGTFVLPGKPFCFECQGESFTYTDLPGTGTVYSFTIIRHPLGPHLKDVVPYVSGIIELDGTQGAGARLIGNIVGGRPEDVAIGDPVTVEFEPLGEDYAMMRFRRTAAT